VILVACLLISAASPRALAGQSFRTLLSSRERRGEKELNVTVEFAAGNFHLTRDAAGALYRSKITYNEDGFRPISTYENGELSLGLKTNSSLASKLHSHDADQQTMDLSISPDVPASLNLQFVAGKADLDLGGLNLTRAEIKTGATESRVFFSSPTKGTCESLRFQVGAAQFTAGQVGNARCRNFELLGGVGDLTVDFTGDWGPMKAINSDIKVGMGSLKLEFPKDAGIEIDVNRVLSSFDQPGFQKKGDSYYSSNWETAKRRLHLDLTTALGSVEVAWQ
jgi:hypothetical protein